jgi:CRISPR-associated protein (TIGR02584 family)
MKLVEQKAILLCVAGLTPQIITETLYALTQQRGERVDEIRVITTLAGRDRIMNDLLTPQWGKFFEFCQDFHIDPQQIKFDRTCIYLLHRPDGQMLEDIRSVSDNEAAANQICDIVRRLTEEPNTRIHASAAGGRKTMSVYLTAALQLFGRTNDQLSHVLVSEDFETHPEFFYKPPAARTLEKRDRQGNVIRQLSTADAEIHLADIPFIRLRGILSQWLAEDRPAYREMVLRAQENLAFLEFESAVRLCPEDYSIAVETSNPLLPSRSVVLTPREFFVYALFAHFSKQNRNGKGFVALTEIRVDDLDAVFRYVTRAKGEELSIENSGAYPGFEFLDALAKRVGSRNAIDCDDVRKTFTETFSRINRKLFERINRKFFEDTDISERYLIHNTGPRKAARYGLNVSPERILLS